MLGFHAECCIHGWLIIALQLTIFRAQFLSTMALDREWQWGEASHS